MRHEHALIVRLQALRGIERSLRIAQAHFEPVGGHVVIEPVADDAA